MILVRRCRNSASLIFGCVFWLALPGTMPAQQTLGSIVGHVRVARGDVPPERVLVTLEVRGAAMDSVYTDSQGTFGFHNLGPNPYYVLVDDDHYQPTRAKAVVDPDFMAPTVFLNITLTPKVSAKETAAALSAPSGTNPNLADVREYSVHFPKHAVKEFDKGVEADRRGKRDEAVKHYEKAVLIAPNFYPAHNNLGSDYLSRSDFAAARKEFEQVVRLNQSDAAAYLNLSNVHMLMGQLPEAQHFLEEGMRRQPDSAMGHYLLGTLDLRLGRMPEAEHALRQAVQLDPVMVQPRLQLVNFLLEQGRKQDAVAELHAFLNSFPDTPFHKRARELLQRLESPATSPESAPR